MITLGLLKWLTSRPGIPGHIPGAVKVDWHLDLNDQVRRDYVDGERFAQVLGERGIGRDTIVIIYGDKSNWWAAYALWVFTSSATRMCAFSTVPGPSGQ